VNIFFLYKDKTKKTKQHSFCGVYAGFNLGKIENENCTESPDNKTVLYANGPLLAIKLG